MRSASSQIGLKCPYCDEDLPSHQDLRNHIGSAHRDRVDEFAEKYMGGRWIEADFITLMLQNYLRDLKESTCEKCGECISGCPPSTVSEAYDPRRLMFQVKEGLVRGLLKADTAWMCTGCMSCEERCPYETSPYQVIHTLRNLSSRIGYHFPREYRELDRRVYQSGLIQGPRAIKNRSGQRFERADLGLPEVDAPVDMEKFAGAIEKLRRMRVAL